MSQQSFAKPHLRIIKHMNHPVWSIFLPVCKAPGANGATEKAHTLKIFQAGITIDTKVLASLKKIARSQLRMSTNRRQMLAGIGSKLEGHTSLFKKNKAVTPVGRIGVHDLAGASVDE